MKNRALIAALAWSIAFASSAWSASHGLDGHWVNTDVDNAPQLSLKLDTNRNRMEVTLPKNPSLSEPHLGVTFFRQDGTQTTLELSAIHPARPGSGTRGAGSRASTFQGSVNPWDSSYVGFEIRIPLSSGPQVISSSKLKRLAK